eukprot:3045869-Rhodomonas_salina.1
MPQVYLALVPLAISAESYHIHLVRVLAGTPTRHATSDSPQNIRTFRDAFQHLRGGFRAKHPNWGRFLKVNRHPIELSSGHSAART